MKPHEFFDLTPHEVGTWLGPSWQGQMETAWRREAVRRMKRLPRKPSDLWGHTRKLMTPEQMHKHMRSAMEELKAPKERSLVGKSMRDIDRSMKDFVKKK